MDRMDCSCPVRVPQDTQARRLLLDKPSEAAPTWSASDRLVGVVGTRGARLRNRTDEVGKVRHLRMRFPPRTSSPIRPPALQPRQSISA